jgi:gamma-glutamyltranspeptidase/glutathione hydrolase
VQTTRPEIVGNFGAASSSHWIASACAMRMLEMGGNAFDAAVAGGLVLQVVAPHLNGPAGDTAILLYRSSDKSSASICGQGPVPEAATLERFRALGLDLVPGTGLLPAVVPGAFDAWMRMLLDYGRMDIESIFQPVIHYAEHGVPVSPRLHETLSAASGLFNRYWPNSQKLYLPNGDIPEVDSLMKNPPLAKTLRRIVSIARSAGSDRLDQIEAARKVWSQGFVADAIDQFCRTEKAIDVTGRVHSALLTGDDIAKWSASVEAPVMLGYGDWKIAKCGPWSQGPALLQTLALLSPEEMAALDPLGAEFVHRVTESMKLAFADREIYYGEPSGGGVPLDRLLSQQYTDLRRNQISPEANNHWRPGCAGTSMPTFDYEAAANRKREEGLLSAYGGGEPTVSEVSAPDYLASVAGDTCHIDVVDNEGNMVSATPSGGWLQSSPVIPELGFPLGTRAQMTWLDANSPSRLQSGTRPRTTLSPTLVLDQEECGYLACGTPGGDQQDQWQAIFLLRHLVHGYGLQDSIEAPSFHSEHWPNSFYPRHASPGKLVVESRFDPAEVANLRRRGHDLVENGPWSEGRLTAVSRERDGRVRAAANPRDGIGYAIGR